MIPYSTIKKEGLEKFYRLTVDKEIKILGLRKRIDELERRGMISLTKKLFYSKII